ncbi:P1 family peptidase [Glutamicibacter uratoxydans]|uniref:P1 family peptidase n=1 Tax=Glutamicibacter uratoxydans TaxID=43667 RepID=UPI003D6DB28B
MSSGSYTKTLSLPGVSIGHWTDPVAVTGCTVVMFPENTVASYEVRGGSPAARELDVLDPQKSVGTVDAVMLTGGSAFGLAAADGVMRFLEEQGRGVQTPVARVPIVPTLGLFDLGIGDATVRPTAASGYSAAEQAHPDTVVTGPVGAGTGACSSQWRGPEARYRAGLVYAERHYGALVVGALVAVNAFGDILVPGHNPGLEVAEFFEAEGNAPQPRNNTTIGVVMTNAKLDKVACRIVAEGAHDGLARAVHPPHSRFDGDAFIAAATGQVAAAVDTVRFLASLAVADAIESALVAP